MFVASALASLSAFLKMSIVSVENVFGELRASKLVMGIFGLYPYRVPKGEAAIVDWYDVLWAKLRADFSVRTGR